MDNQEIIDIDNNNYNKPRPLYNYIISFLIFIIILLFIAILPGNIMYLYLVIYSNICILCILNAYNDTVSILKKTPSIDRLIFESGVAVISHGINSILIFYSYFRISNDIIYIILFSIFGSFMLYNFIFYIVSLNKKLYLNSQQNNNYFAV
jgi:hypothetical protein